MLLGGPLLREMIGGMGAPDLRIDLHLLCDRKDETEKIKVLIDPLRMGYERGHAFAVVEGFGEDGHEDLVQRLVRHELGTAGAIGYPTIAPAGVTEGERFRQNFLISVFDHVAGGVRQRTVRELTMHPYWHNYKLVVLHHRLRVGRNESPLEGFLEWYVGDFWKDAPSEGPPFLVVLSVIRSMPVWRRIPWTGNPSAETAAMRAARALEKHGVRCKYLRLGTVTRECVADWLFDHMDIRVESDRYRQARRVCGAFGQRTRMVPILKHLQTLRTDPDRRDK